MTHARFGQLIQSEDALRAVIPAPPDGTPAVRKQIDHLDGHCRDFIDRSPFLVLATAGDGSADASPRGGHPGFVRVLDVRHLLIPEYPGNRRVDSHRNLLEDSRAALLFMIPGLRETLRVAGRGRITRDAALLAELAVGERPPVLGIGLEVEEAFIHCAKALIRSDLWQPESWPREVPSASRILRDHMDVPDVSVADIEERLDEAYVKDLY